MWAAPWASSAAQLLGLASVYRLLQECGFAQILRILSFFLPGLKDNTPPVGSSTAQLPPVTLTNCPPTDSNCSPRVPACSLHTADITADPGIFTSAHPTRSSPSQRPQVRLRRLTTSHLHSFREPVEEDTLGFQHYRSGDTLPRWPAAFPRG